MDWKILYRSFSFDPTIKNHFVYLVSTCSQHYFRNSFKLEQYCNVSKWEGMSCLAYIMLGHYSRGGVITQSSKLCFCDVCVWTLQPFLDGNDPLNNMTPNDSGLRSLHPSDQFYNYNLHESKGSQRVKAHTASNLVKQRQFELESGSESDRTFIMSILITWVPLFGG